MLSASSTLEFKGQEQQPNFDTVHKAVSLKLLHCTSGIDDQTAGRKRNCGERIMETSGLSKSCTVASFDLISTKKSVIISLVYLLVSVFHGTLSQTNTIILNPKITNAAGSVVFISGQKNTLLCQLTVATNLAPASPFPLSWDRPIVPLPMDVHIVNSLPLVLNGTTSYESRLTIEASPNDNDRPIRCSAVLGIYAGSSTYTPSLIMTPNDPVVTGPLSIRAGEPGTWTCLSDGASVRKPNVTFRDRHGVNLVGRNVRQSVVVDVVENDNIVYEVTLDVTLTIPSVLLSPTYTLICHVVHITNFNTAEKETPYAVNVLFAPRVTKDGEHNIVATESTFLTLSCVVIAGPPATTISWSKDGISVDMSSSRFLGATTNSPSLTIISLQKNDLGNYTCSATNDEGSGSFATPTSLTITYKPRLTVPSSPMILDVGSDVLLPCAVDAHPKETQLYWTRNGAGLLTSNNPNPVKYLGGTVSNPSLTILNAELSDSGNYQCVAINSIGQGSSGTLMVGIGNVPVITPISGPINRPLGATVTLSCSVEADPPTTSLYWVKIGEGRITSPGGRYRGGDTTSPNLVISDALTSDTGDYYCFASNTLGNATSDPVTLNIVELPEKPSLTAFFKNCEASSEMHSIKNQTIFIFCEVNSGKPPVHSVTLSCQFPISYSDEEQLTVPGTSIVINKMLSPDVIGKRCTCIGNHVTGGIESSPLTLGGTEARISCHESSSSLGTSTIVGLVLASNAVIIVLTIISMIVVRKCRKRDKPKTRHDNENGRTNAGFQEPEPDKEPATSGYVEVTEHDLLPGRDFHVPSRNESETEYDECQSTEDPKYVSIDDLETVTARTESQHQPSPQVQERHQKPF